jgi:DNA-binding response OmpR family regulator
VDDRSLRSYYGGPSVGEPVVDAPAGTPGASTDTPSGTGAGTPQRPDASTLRGTSADTPQGASVSREAATLLYGNLEIRADEIQALIDGRRVGLTVREFQVLCVLAKREDRVVRRADIYNLVWGGEMKHRDRSVDVFVRKVRTKLARVAPDWAYIHTHFGVGYRFAATPPASPSG